MCDCWRFDPVRFEVKDYIEDVPDPEHDPEHDLEWGDPYEEERDG